MHGSSPVGEKSGTARKRSGYRGVSQANWVGDPMVNSRDSGMTAPAARGAFDRAAEAAEKRPDESVTTYWDRGTGLREVMSAQARSGDAEGARETSTRVRRSKTNDARVQEDMVNAVAEGQARAG